MEPDNVTNWEQTVETLARRFEYPPAPDLVARVNDRIGRRKPVVRPRAPRLAWALFILALVLLGLVAVPQTRAALLTFFARIGAIEIYIDPDASTPVPVAPTFTATPAVQSTPQSLAGEAGHAAHSLELFELGEATTLEEAGRRMHFTLKTPRSLAEPDGVYVHTNVDLPAVTFVWQSEDGQLISLSEIGIAAFAQKMVNEQGVVRTEVGDYPAVWLEGPHRLQLLGNWQESSLLIDSNVLIWTDGEITYRLESPMTPDDAQRIAASLTPVGD